MHLVHTVSGGDLVRTMSSVIPCCRGSNYLALYIELKVALAHLLESRKEPSPCLFLRPVLLIRPLILHPSDISVASCTSLRATSSTIIRPTRRIIVRTSRASFPRSGKGMRSPVVSSSCKASDLPPYGPALHLPMWDRMLSLSLLQ